MVSTTRAINWRTEVSRSEVPCFPWKYLLATMLVAVCDQLLGTSTFSCLKIVTPFSLPIRAVRLSHSTLSNGETFPSVKNRSNTNPADVAVFDTSTAFPFNACFTVAILFPPRHRFPKSGGEPYSLLPWKPGGRGFARNPQPDPGIGRFSPPEITEKNECAVRCRCG